jgi:pSer/pThr/pTyr-binding forkhead associated (FHA) protein
MSIIPTGDRSGALAALGVQVGPQAGEEVPIHLPVVTIGKGKQSDIVLPDDSISSTHARLEYDQGAWRITDLNSTNGTYVESVRLAPQVPTPLPFGASVRLGGVKLHFRAVETADPEAARAAYTPPPRETTIRERKDGFRLPVWLLLLLLVLVVLAALLVYGWLWTGPGAEPIPASEPVPAAPAPAPGTGTPTTAPAPEPVAPAPEPAAPTTEPAATEPASPDPAAPAPPTSLLAPDAWSAEDGAVLVLEARLQLTVTTL